MTRCRQDGILPINPRSFSSRSKFEVFMPVCRARTRRRGLIEQQAPMLVIGVYHGAIDKFCWYDIIQTRELEEFSFQTSFNKRRLKMSTRKMRKVVIIAFPVLGILISLLPQLIVFNTVDLLPVAMCGFGGALIGGWVSRELGKMPPDSVE